MRGKVHLFLISAVCLLCLFAAGAVADEGQNLDQAEVRQEKALKIRAYLAQRQRQIEQFYTDSAIELELRAEAQMTKLEVSETIGVVLLSEWAALKATGTVLEINGFDSGSCGYYESEYDAVPHRLELAENQVERLVIAKSRIADLISHYQAQIQWQLRDLERQKSYALRVELPAMEQRLKQSLLESKPKPPAGVVTGILYCPDKPAAIINGTVVHRSQELDGVKVIEIYPDRVEFEKAGRRWHQKVRDEASRFWK